MLGTKFLRKAGSALIQITVSCNSFTEEYALRLCQASQVLQDESLYTILRLVGINSKTIGPYTIRSGKT